MKNAFLVILLVATICPARASGPPLTMHWPLDPYGGTQAERAAFHDGHAGIGSA